MSEPLAGGLRPVKHDKPMWTDQDLKLIAFDLATKYLVDKSAGKPTPLAQLVHEKLMEMRDALAAALADERRVADEVMVSTLQQARKAYEAFIAKLEAKAENLKAATDPELLTIAYGKGYADAQDKARQQIAELEAKCLQLEARSINLGMTDEMQRNELAEKDNLIAELTAQLAACNKSLDGHVWAYSTTGEDAALEDEAFAALEEGEEYDWQEGGEGDEHA